MAGGLRTVAERVVVDQPGRCYAPRSGTSGAARVGRAKSGPVPALDAPDGRVTGHPAWPAFVSWVRAGGDATHRVVRPDLLACRREAWEFVWEVFRAGWVAKG